MDTPKKEHEREVNIELDIISAEIYRLQKKYDKIKKNNNPNRNINTHNQIYNNTTNQVNNLNNSANVVNSNNNNTSITNIFAFGKEDLSHISDDVFRSILAMGYAAVPTLVDKIHFSEDNPANHNVYVSNLQNKYAIIYDGDDWGVINKSEVIDRIFEDKRDILETKFGVFSGKLNRYAVARFKKMLSKNGTDKEIKIVKNDIMTLLYNKRHLPKAARNRVEMTMIDDL